MNEESHFPKATDDTLLEKLHNQHSVRVQQQLFDEMPLGFHVFGVLRGRRFILKKLKPRFASFAATVLR